MLNVIKDKFQVILNDKNVIEDSVFDIGTYQKFCHHDQIPLSLH